MRESEGVERRVQFCARCGQEMIEYFRAPDGHFGLVTTLRREDIAPDSVIRCRSCGARYRLLSRLDAQGRPVARL